MVRDQAQVRFLAGCLDAAVDTKPLYPQLNKTVKRSQNPARHRIAPVTRPFLGAVADISRAGSAYKSNGQTVEKRLGLLPGSDLWARCPLRRIIRIIRT